MFRGMSADKLSFLDSRHVRPGNGFVPNFLLFEKGDVNGEDEQEVFTFLKVHHGLLAKVIKFVLSIPFSIV